MISFYEALKGERGQAWDRITAKYVLAANLLGREHEGSRSSVNILNKDYCVCTEMKEKYLSDH